MHQIAKDWTKASLSEANRALCRYAMKLTLGPKEMTNADIESLRSHGFSDAAIHDAVQVIAYFNYINRVADALDVDHETFVPAWELAPPSP